MPEITVTASVAYTYDTRDEVVETPEEAVRDVEEMLDSGRLTAGDFEFVVAGAPSPWTPPTPKTIADLDGTVDEPTWLTPGYVMDAADVEWVRSLRVPPILP